VPKPATRSTGGRSSGAISSHGRSGFRQETGGGTRVDHAPHREAGQRNVPTILHWGDTLGQLLRSTPMQGRVVTLSRLSSDEYELTIA
jgi:hypothetical protein